MFALHLTEAKDSAQAILSSVIKFYLGREGNSGIYKNSTKYLCKIQVYSKQIKK